MSIEKRIEGVPLEKEKSTTGLTEEEIKRQKRTAEKDKDDAV